MIRKLKVGEIIREGDFFTESNKPVDEYHTKVCKTLMGSEVNKESSEEFPVFREIPDGINIELLIASYYDYGKFIGFESMDNSQNLEAEQARRLGLWLLEVAEFIEEGERS